MKHLVARESRLCQVVSRGAADSRGSEDGDASIQMRPGIYDPCARSSPQYDRLVVRAVLFDFGGVILTSPFEAFAAYEARAGLAPGAIRAINSTNPDTNAWARLERAELDLEEFSALFESEAAALGHRVSGEQVIECLHGEVRPEMVRAIERLRAHGYSIALLTNNFVSGTPQWSSGGSFAELVDLFDVIVESAVVGCRKPEPRFYEVALERLGIDAREAVFLDDLGINLKPAAVMGMRTIKVTDPAVALAELEVTLGVALR